MSDLPASLTVHPGRPQGPTPSGTHYLGQPPLDLQYRRGHSSHDDVTPHRCLRNGQDTGRDVDLQALGQYHEGRQVHGEQLAQEALQTRATQATASHVLMHWF